LADGHPLGQHDIASPANTVIALGEVNSKYAVEWTRPDDIDAEKITILKRILRPRDDQFIVGYLDGFPRAIPVDTQIAEWRKAINCGDREKPKIDTQNPSKAPADNGPRIWVYSGAKPPAKRPALADGSGGTIKLKDDVKIGTVVGTATGAPAGY